MLMMLFFWNSVLGGMNALVLCLHSGADAHVELIGNDAYGADTGCIGSEDSIAESDCPPCVDLVLESADLGPIRALELASVQVFVPLISSSPEPLSLVALRPSLQVAMPHPKRGPGVEPASEMISRTIVLRL